MAALVPLALQAHAGEHPAAASALWLHVVGAGAWMGGLAVLALLYGTGRQGELLVPLRRYSAVALLSFAVVGGSGIVGASVRLEPPEQLISTAYGVLILAKAAALIVLGAAGARHRSRLLRDTEKAETPPQTRRRFWRLVTAELVLMGVATGLASVLARTALPDGEEPAVGPSERLAGQPLPGPLDAGALATAWAPAPVWLLAATLGAVGYLIGVRRLRGRGADWSAGRATAWLAGVALLAYTTSGAPALYGTYLFSVHLLAQVALAVVVPALLVLGAPVRLVRQATTARTDGSRGLREWIIPLADSRSVRILTHPVVAGLLFAATLFLFYFSPSFGWALREPLGREWMIAQFLVAGSALAQSLLGTRPSRRRRALPTLELVVLAAVMGLQAALGISVAVQTGLLLPDWYGPLGVEWGVDPLNDQRRAGSLAALTAAASGVSLGLIIVLRWRRKHRRPCSRRIPGACRADRGPTEG